MIKFTDSMGHTQSLEFSKSHDPEYINLTMFSDKHIRGSIIQFPKVYLEELRDNLTKLIDHG